MDSNVIKELTYKTLVSELECGKTGRRPSNVPFHVSEISY